MFLLKLNFSALIVGLIMTQFCLATEILPKSKLDPRLQQLVVQTIKKASSRNTVVEEMASRVSPIHIDQGVIDQKIDVQVLVLNRVDQMLYDEYICDLEIYYSDSYNHTQKNWGSYEVRAVECNIK